MDTTASKLFYDLEKKGIAHFLDRSEPHFLIEVMDRHKDWCSQHMFDRWRLGD